jgi:hypothetical protein
MRKESLDRFCGPKSAMHPETVSNWRFQQIERGFNPDKLLMTQLEFPGSRYRNDAQVMSFVAQLNECLKV